MKRNCKLTLGRGTSLKPVPPVTPIGMGKDSQGVDLASVDDLNARQAASWMRQAAAKPGFGGGSVPPFGAAVWCGPVAVREVVAVGEMLDDAVERDVFHNFERKYLRLGVLRLMAR